MHNEEAGAKMTNCTFFGNAAQSNGGAIYTYGTTGLITAINCVFSGNMSTTDGKDFASYSQGSRNLANCIFWGSDSPIYELLTGHISVSHSIVQQSSGIYPGTGNLNADPLFEDQVNGNLRLKTESPAINAGDDAANNTTYDLDGNARKVGTIDMGAYELQSSAPSCTPISLTTTSLNVLQTSGCGTVAIASITFAYSTTPVTLTAAQYATLNLSIAEGSCDIASVKYTDAINQALNMPGKVVVVRTFTVTDVNGATATATQQIKVVDATAPTVLTKNITAQLTTGGSVIVTAAQVNNGSSDACGIQSYSLDKTTFFCNNIGNNTVMLTVTDVNGNTATGTATVKVEDKAPPTVLTKKITVQLEPGGIATITPQQVDNGSYDACGLALYSLDKTTFNCNNVGANTVTLTVKDANGNTASGTATVTVVDNVKPTVLTKNITVQLEPGGTVTITPQQIDNGSYDPCGLVLYSLDKTTFNCNNIGANTVTLTVKDANGNTASANATVTVEDKVAPIALAKNITAQITQGGDAIITASQVNNGSYDACGGVTLSLSKYTFYCENIGPNTVILTATDASGNTASATAIVTVEDHVPPTMFTKNITVQLDATGSATITHPDIDNGSYN